MSAGRPIPPDAVRWIARTLEEAGFETWAVGGAIRDALSGRASGDWDLATRATPKQVRRIFRRTVPIGIAHGTVGVLAGDGVMYEVTTFRKDVETDGRHAVVAFARTIEEDLARRDFTINAIAWHPLREEYVDPYEGAEDLEAGLVRTVGAPSERFREDYLRILRAIRFAGRFGFEIEPATWRAITELAEHLVGLSPERVREELLKVLGSDPEPARALALYMEGGVARVLYPELARLEDATWTRTLAVVEALPIGRPLLRLAALVRPLPGKDAAALLVRLRLSNADTDAVATIAAAKPMPGASDPDADRRRWLSRCGVKAARGVARLDLATARSVSSEEDRVEATSAVVASWHAIRRVRRSDPPLSVGDLAIGGRDLMQLGLKPGPRFRDVLESLLGQVLEDPSRNVSDVLVEEARLLVARLEREGTAR